MIVRAIVQAHMLNKQLRGKSILPVNGKPLLTHIVEFAQSLDFVDEIVIATTSSCADEPIILLCEKLGVKSICGDKDNVLSRFVSATDGLKTGDIIVRLSADNIFYDQNKTIQAFREHISSDFDYTHIDSLSHMVPEFIKVGALKKTNEMAFSEFDLIHVTPYIRKNPTIFKIKTLPADFLGLRPELNKYFQIENLEELERAERMIRETSANKTSVCLEDYYYWIIKENIGLFNYIKVPDKEIFIKISGHKVGNQSPCFIVGEIGQNHNGQMGIAKRLIDMAAKSKCNAVKFQKRDISCELTKEAYAKKYSGPNSFGETYGQHREFLEFDKTQHLELKEYAQALGLVYMCTACDEPSVDIMEAIGNPVYKIASRDLTNIPLLKKIVSTGKPIILSTGMATMEEIKNAIEIVEESNCGFILTHCVSQYPTDLKNVNLRAINGLKEQFKCLIGLSDHTTGIITSVAGFVLGACYIEKHITLSREMPGTDHSPSLEYKELKQMVEHIRTCEIALGDGVKKFLHSTLPAKDKLARSLTSRSIINKGDILSEDMLTLKSPGTGLSWENKNKIIGKKAMRNIDKDSILEIVDFQ